MSREGVSSDGFAGGPVVAQNLGGIGAGSYGEVGLTFGGVGAGPNGMSLDEEEAPGVNGCSGAGWKPWYPGVKGCDGPNGCGGPWVVDVYGESGRNDLGGPSGAGGIGVACGRGLPTFIGGVAGGVL